MARHDITVADVLGPPRGIFGLHAQRHVERNIRVRPCGARALRTTRRTAHERGGGVSRRDGWLYSGRGCEDARRVNDLRHALYELVRGPLGFEWFDYGAPGKDISQVAQNYVTGWPNIFPFKQLVEYAIGSSFETIVGFSRDERFYNFDSAIGEHGCYRARS
jgi:hypothetical protein